MSDSMRKEVSRGQDDVDAASLIFFEPVTLRLTPASGGVIPETLQLTRLGHFYDQLEQND
jgi:hypothetical protein